MPNALIQRFKHRLFRTRIPLTMAGLDEVLASSPDLTLALPAWSQDRRAGDLFDSVVIASIARVKRPGVYFEIGTGDGRSSLLVAANTPASTRLFTLDPFYPQDPVKGSVFRGKPEASKIQMLSGSSTDFDFTPWLGKVDMVFVDGSHHYANVVKDCETAFKLAKGDGWVLWHDVAPDSPEVFKAIAECRHAADIRLIRNTRYAIYRGDHRLAK